MDVPSETIKRILIVDDEVGMLRALQFALAREGFEPITAQNGAEALRSLSQHHPDLVLLDVMMPEMDGWVTCRQVRQVSDVPIIMLTARGGEEDIVRGLGVGADDYITKPFPMSVLLARVRAVLRRTALVSVHAGPGRLTYGGGQLVIDFDRRVTILNGDTKSLSATEFRLLNFLVVNAGKVLSHGQLLKHVWGPEYVGETSYIKVYIRALRAKVEPDRHNPKYILGRRGLGYFFNGHPETCLTSGDQPGDG